VPVAVATPPVIAHDVGTKTAGSSPADDNGTEVCTGSVIDGPTDAAAATELDDGELDDGAPDGAELAACDGLAGGGLADNDGDRDSDTDGDKLGEAEADAGGVAGTDAFRLPACLPMKNAPIASPIRTTNATIARLRLLDGVIEPTYPLA
jgi:hypothetical protein